MFEFVKWEIQIDKRRRGVILSAAKDLRGSRRPSRSEQILQSLSLHQDDDWSFPLDSPGDAT
jgi:hypothetical protein